MNNSYKNVMFVIADDWSRIAKCYGNEIIRTPHIDAFAERGVVFDYAFCTSPSCAVSRACILTGQHSHTHGQYGHCHGIHGFPHTRIHAIGAENSESAWIRDGVHRKETR